MRAVRFGSVCSGIEAASVAWEPLGWSPAWFAESAEFPGAVLAHRWPTVPNLGDITADEFISRVRGFGTVDVLVGGTPCQGFSVIGKRGGLSDPRSALAVRFLEVAESLRPQWLVWENVPGCLTTDGGRDFGALIGRVAELGFRWAYRVLDARFFGVAQRRRRVFLVGSLGAGDPSHVLFEQGVGDDGVGQPGSLADRPGAGGPDGSDPGDGATALTVTFRQRAGGTVPEVGGRIANALKANDGRGLAHPHVWRGRELRRLTPLECERLQGFPDGHTLVPFFGGESPNSLRYRAIGNSIAVPVLRWLGLRLAAEMSRVGRD